jgi:spermidine synthase
VVAAARAHFSLPPDDARLSVEIGDGAEALAPECCDVLMIDAFHDEQHAPAMSLSAFYDAAYLALTEPGVLVVNFMDDDRQLDPALQRLEAAFGGAVLAMHTLYDPNIVAFALKGLPARFEFDELRRRAGRLEARLGLPFTRYVSKLRGMNRCTATELLVAA